MKKRSIRKLSGAIGALLISVFAASCGSNSQDTGGAASDTADTAAASQNELVFTENKVGSYDGYDYELWKDTGDTTFTVKSGGTFSCKWSDINNALFRRGQKFDCTKTYDEIGNMSINYGVDYRPDGNSYMCVYGWTRDPLVEFYIVQSWGTWRPPGAPMSLGRVVIDGDTYDIYKTIRVNQPSIDGTKTFDQYWSVRDVKPESSDDRIEGTISITKHFDAWAECGLELGKMYETALTIEGYQSNGEADVYKNELIIEDTYTKSEDLDLTVNGAVKKAEKKSSDTAQTSEGPVMFKSDFESETDGWNGRGSAQVSLTDEFSDEGEKSLYVSGRSENWNGAAINLDSGIFSPGSVCSFGARAMQNSGDTAQIKLTLQYDTDITHYDQVAMASAASGEWVTLENAEFIIPDGAQNLILYVESPDSLCDLYIDNAYAGVTDGSAAPAADSSETLAKTEVEHHDSVAVPNNADISWIDTSKPMVAIAFDDGASAVKKTDPAYRIIDTMADNGFHATFFYVSDWIKTEAQVKYAHEKGMEIANHTKTHPYLSKCEPDIIRSEVETADKRLKEIIGTEPSKLLRLPYLDCNETVKNVLYDTPLISCSVDTKDWSGKTKDEIVDTLKKAKENGTLENAIVLCHENYETTADAMAEIVPWLKSEGWQVVTVSELFAANDKEMMGGTIYTKVQ